MTPQDKKIIWLNILVCLLVALPAVVHAAKVEDVEVLDIVKGEPGEIELKVRNKASDPASYFFLSFQKESRKNMDQLALMLYKMVKPNQYRIDLTIADFSPYPAGSYYTTSDVRFEIFKTEGLSSKNKPEGSP